MCYYLIVKRFDKIIQRWRKDKNTKLYQINLINLNFKCFFFILMFIFSLSYCYYDLIITLNNFIILRLFFLIKYELFFYCIKQLCLWKIRNETMYLLNRQWIYYVMHFVSFPVLMRSCSFWVSSIQVFPATYFPFVFHMIITISF